jgi:hypothetical protein
VGPGGDIFATGGVQANAGREALFLRRRGGPSEGLRTDHPRAHGHHREQEKQQVIVPKHECREETQECQLGPGVQRPIKHEGFFYLAKLVFALHALGIIGSYRMAS